MSRNWIKLWLISAGVGAALAVAPAVPAAATPSLWYVLAQISHGVDTCVKRAQAALATEVSGTLRVNSPRVGLVNPDFNIAVHCVTRGGGTLAIVIVAHRTSVNEARGVALNIRSGIQSGLFE